MNHTHYAVPNVLFMTILKTLGIMAWHQANPLMVELQKCKPIPLDTQSNDNPRPTSAVTAGPGRATAASPAGDQPVTDKRAGPAANGA